MQSYEELSVQTCIHTCDIVCFTSNLTHELRAHVHISVLEINMLCYSYTVLSNFWWSEGLIQNGVTA